MHKHHNCLRFMIILFTICLSHNLTAQTNDIDSEIRKIRKELMQVQEERRRVSDEVKKDKTDFETYRKRTLERMRALRIETDSLRNSAAILSLSKDSVDAIINAEKNNTHRYELLQNGYRLSLVAACDTASSYASLMPPLISGRIISALKLLKDELNASTVDNIEATTRLAQICKDMHEQGGTIQIVQGTSPISDIRGTTYSIRIGSIFEAIVNTQGSQAAIWVGGDKDGTPEWKMINDPLISQNILKAVNVREGKSLPALVELPIEAKDIARVK